MDALSATAGVATAVRPPRRSAWWILEDLGDDRVRVLQVDREGSRVAYSGAAEGAEWEQLAVTARAAQDAGKAWVAAILPGSVTLWRMLEAPAAAKARRPAVLANLLDVQLPFAVEDAVCCFLDPGSGPIAAVACRRTDLTARRTAWAAWDPAFWWPEGVALQSLAGEGGVVRVAGRRATLGWTKDGTWRIQTVPVSPEDAAAKVARAVAGLDAPPGGWQVLSEDSALPTRLSEESGEATWTAAPSEALAVSARQTGSTAGLPCFRTPLDPHPGVFGASARAERQAPAALAGVGVVLLVASQLMAFGNNEVKKASDARVTTLARELAGTPKIPYGQELLVVQRALAEQRGGDQVVEAVVQGGPWSQVGPLLDWCRTRGVTLQGIDWSLDRIQLDGAVLGWETAESLRQHVESFGFDADVQRGDPVAEGPIPFRLQGVRS